MNTKIEYLSQEQTDKIMKSLPPTLLEGFREAFQDERDRMEKQEVIWALSPEHRQYYLVYLNELPYLLVGIEKYINISSFVRIVEEPKGHASDCLKQLIEERLIPRCFNLTPSKPVIYSRVNEGDARYLKE